eukprot:jgi/Psemu1/328874/estExt_fgenesh1_pg.C_27380001
MSEITLTGGTLVPSSSPSSSSLSPKGDSGSAGKTPGIPPLLAKLTAVEAANARSTHTHTRTPLFGILQKSDEGGHTLFHWASKRVDDLRFLRALVELAHAQEHAGGGGGGDSATTTTTTTRDLLNRASEDNVGMRPIHWACTEGSIPHVALLLHHGADPEAQDHSGCTPLLIAAQYGRVEVVAYLLQKGANLQAVDSSRDTALHWAAYKGSNEVCGLLTHYQQLSFAAQDAYGQSPLHLAALRGNTSVVRYILQQLHLGRNNNGRKNGSSNSNSNSNSNLTAGERGVLFVKDKNGRTPLDLAIHKQKRNVEFVLREAMAAAEDPRGHFFRKTLWNSVREMASLRSWQFWCGMAPQTDEMDAPSRVPFYIVLINMALHLALMVGVMAPFANAGEGLLWDKSGLLLLDFVLMGLTWYSYAKTVRTEPGFLDDSHPDIGKWRRLYEETLESLAEHEHENENETTNHQPKRPFELCHTCHVARPHRSKHCRVTRKCVLVFDHFCPFVDNTVGLYNYHYFCMFLVSITTALLAFSVTLATYVSRYRSAHGSFPWLVLALGTELALIFFPCAGLVVYHAQLIGKNLTTNESMNAMRYKYLFPVIGGRRVYHNPWNQGFVVGNLLQKMNPSRACYEIPSDFESLIQKDAPMPVLAACCRHGKCENV